MVKLIHAADLHLDSPFAGLSPQLAAKRREEQRQLLGAMVELARSRKADAILLSGDLLDSADTYRETVQALSEQLGKAGCPVFIAPGNHDCYNTFSPYATMEWPENVHIFSTQQVEGVELPGKNCTIYGAAFTQPHMDRSPLEGFAAPRDGQLHIMALHGEVDGRGRYGSISRETIAASGLDYLALGHVHRCSDLQQEGDTFWAYPGCPEGRGFDELGEKGVLYAEVEPGQCRVEFVPLAQRRYEILQVDLTGQEDPLRAISKVLRRDPRQDIYRIVFTGEYTAGMDLPALERTLAPLFFALTLQDNTHAPQQLWARMEENTLTGHFLREMFRRCQEDPDNETLQLAVQFGLAALEGGEDPAP